jgi:hypothetical protein
MRSLISECHAVVSQAVTVAVNIIDVVVVESDVAVVNAVDAVDVFMKVADVEDGSVHVRGWEVWNGVLRGVEFHRELEARAKVRQTMLRNNITNQQ